MPYPSLPSFRIKGNIIRVLDGDTLVVAVKIRLSNVNAPELGTPVGEEEKKRLRRWGKKNDLIVIERNGEDLYSRILGRIARDEEEGEIYY